MADDFEADRVQLHSPAGGAAAITPNDSTDLSTVTRGIYVGGAGNIAADMMDGTAVTVSGALAGTVLPLRVKRVKSTNTTATNLLALY